MSGHGASFYEKYSVESAHNLQWYSDLQWNTKKHTMWVDKTTPHEM